MTPDERQVFEAWRKASPRHEQAYRDMMRVWDVAKATPDQVFENILRRPPQSAVAGFSSRRRMLALGVGTACCAAVAAVSVGPERWLQSPIYSGRYASPRGERRIVDLPDGSALTLNTDSIVQVRFYESERRVLLERGEAFFSIASAMNRPFVVDAGVATVTVTGTQFNVRRDTGQVSVAVESGSVEVAGGAWWKREVRRLGAAQSVQVASSTAVSEVSAANLGRLTAWRQGKVVFDAEPLAVIVAEMNRYRVQPVRLRSAVLQGLRVAGVFSTDNPDAFLDVLPSLAPVAVLRLPDGCSEIVPR
jgi:transmembrane sensor